VKEVLEGTIPESELACALLMKELLTRAQTKDPAQVEVWPQFTITRQGFAESLKELVGEEEQLFYLIEGGEPLAKTKIDLASPLVFVLGDHQGVPPEHEKMLMQQNAQKICIGERSLLGSQITSLVLLELARRLGIDRRSSET
jgi:tRNA pseudouridine-54 N-methylase